VEVVHHQRHMHPEAPKCRERGLKALAERWGIKQMEELVAAELIRPPAVAGKGGLEQKLKEQASHDFDLLLRDTRAFTEKDKHRIPAIADSLKIGQFISAQQEPAGPGKGQSSRTGE